MGKPKFYAVHKGRKPGVYKTWEDCQDAIGGASGAMFKSFQDDGLAELFSTTGPRMGCRGMDPTFPNLPHFTPNIDDAYSTVKDYLENSITRWNPATYKFATTPKPVNDPDNVLEWVFTDGSLHNSTGVAKAGVFFGSGSELNMSARVPAKYTQSNQTAELYAIYLALRMGAPGLAIFSDSSYAIKWVSGVFEIREDTANADLIRLTTQALRERQRAFGRDNMVMMLKVPAHCGVLGNEHADALAGLP